MRAKVILTKTSSINTSTKPWTPDSNTRVMKENKAMAQVIWKISILYPKTSKKFYHYIQVSEKYNEQKVFNKKTVLNNFAIVTEKYLCWCIFFNKNAANQACNFINNGLQHSCFLVNIAKYLRTPILKNICVRQPLRFFPFMSVGMFSYINK